MLFHLKEPVYESEAPKNIPTRFYGRNQQQILTTLDYYNERLRKDRVDMNASNLVWWLKRNFSKKDIEPIENGEFNFFTGLLYITDEDKDKPLFEEIRATNDFNIYIPKENIGKFLLWRMDIMQKERGGLYKLQNPIEVFMNISFVPKDIARAIMNCGLTDYQVIIEKDNAKRSELSKHQNIKVDDLQKILEAQTRNLIKYN